jgi:hypothetical protein
VARRIEAYERQLREDALRLLGDILHRQWREQTGDRPPASEQPE